MARLSRRTLMVAGLGAVALPAGLLAWAARASRPDAVVAYLRHALPGLAVAEADRSAFAVDWAGRIDPQGQRKAYYDLMFFLMANPGLEASLPERLRGHLQQFTRRLLTTFLLSTDFFGTAGQQPERTSFVAFADPYALGCRNPLARFDD